MAYQKYSDEQQAQFIIQMEVLGYPDNEHAPKEVAKQKGAPHELTLKRWWNVRHNPEINKLVNNKKRSLVEDLTNLLHLHIDASAEAVVGNEDLRAVNTGIGILVDKLQILRGEPTGIVKVVQLIQEGKVKPETVKQRWPNLANKLFQEAGVDIDAAA